MAAAAEVSRICEEKTERQRELADLSEGVRGAAASWLSLFHFRFS